VQTFSEYTEKLLRPLLGDFILPYELIHVSPALVHSLNERLIKIERTRRTSALLDEQEPFAVVMEDMGPAVEFKPKWLVQSPSAPTDWTTCRTCALNEMRYRQRSFCPLQLLEGGKDTEQALARLCSEPWFAASILGSGVLPLIASIQGLDKHGPLQACNDMDFLIAMTLRDCSVFVTPTEVFVGDLDLKLLDGGKGVYWRDTEQKLIAGGFYHSGSCRR